MNIASFLITNLLNGILGIGLLIGGYIIFDFITPEWDFTSVFKEKGVSGGAIVVAAYIMGLSFVIAATGF